MAVEDLNDLVDSVRRQSSVEVVEAAGLTDQNLIGYLMDAFWEARLDGALTSDHDLDDEFLEPPLSNDLAQLLVIYASFNIVKNRLLQTNTVFRTKAGPVEYEVQQSAQLLTALLKDMSVRRKQLLDKLVADREIEAGVLMFDNISARDTATMNGLDSYTTYWANSSQGGW